MRFDLKKDIVLENDKALLRLLRKDDYDKLLYFSVNEPDIWQFNAFGANGIENLKSYIARTIHNRNAGTEYPFIVFDKVSDQCAGCTRFYDLQFERNTLQIGFTWYGKQFQGTGLNKNCKYLLLEFAFEKLGVDRVGFGANSKNARSIAAMKSIGCTEEGILRNSSLGNKGERIDITVLSILKDEWENGVRDRLKIKMNAATSAQHSSPVKA